MGILIYGIEKIFRDSADGIIPVEENNYLFALNKLTKDNNNPIAMKTVMKETSILVSPQSIVLGFKQLFEVVSVVSLEFNHQKIKNYPPYSKIVENLWPAITIKVIKVF
jgi:hypothetical protein